MWFFLIHLFVLSCQAWGFWRRSHTEDREWLQKQRAQSSAVQFSPLTVWKYSIFQLSFLIARQIGLLPPAKIVYENVTAFSTVTTQENVGGFCLKIINFIDCGYRKGLCKDCVLPISRQLYTELLLCTGGGTAILALQKYNWTSFSDQVSNRCESSTPHCS